MKRRRLAQRLLEAAAIAVVAAVLAAIGLAAGYFTGFQRESVDAFFPSAETDPAVVVVGYDPEFDYAKLTRATAAIRAGARFVATNPDKSGPTEEGIAPANGAMAALMEAASGVRPFFVGKPNPLMMRTALNHLGVHSEQTVMIGDNMETDIIGGLQAGLETVLVLSGVTSRSELSRYSYQPNRVVASVDELER